MNRKLLNAAITLAVIAGIVALFIPTLLRRNISGNETRMIGRATSIATAQERFKQAVLRDLDADRTGEYGYFQHLAERGFLDERFAESAREHGGDVVLDGYRFRMFLPLADGSPRREAHPLPSFDGADANNQETNWVCYAWPDELGVTGNRSGVVNQEGQFYQCSNTVHGWSGAAGAPTGAEAFFDLDDMTGPIVVGAPSADGQTWVPA